MMTSPRVLSIFSTKGGVGKTLLATNLAAVLQRQQSLKTALLDLSGSDVDGATMLGSTGVHRVSGATNAEALPGIITDLCKTSRFVLIDAGSVLNALAVTAFEHSNLILLVTTPDEVAVQHTQQTIEMLGRLKFPMRMIAVVINRAESRGNLSSRDIEQRLPVAVIAQLPSDGRLTSLSVNRKTPLSLLQEDGRLTRAIQQVAQFLVEHPEVFITHGVVDHARLPGLQSDQLPVRLPEETADHAPARRADPLVELKQRIHAKLIENFDLKRVDMNTLNDPAKARQLRERVEKVALEIIAEEGGFTTGGADRSRLVKEIVDDAIGLGPLEDFLADEQVSDILVNGKDQIYVERQGKLSLTGRTFLSNDQLMGVIERIVARLGRRIDESTPMVDARLADGSRVNAIIPPLSIKGPMLSIRKFRRQHFTMENLVALGTLARGMAEFLRVSVIAKKNIIVSGGTGSGKTTVLNTLSSFIPSDERIITIEDSAELRLDKEHWVPLEARSPNIEGKGAISIRQLFRNCLRMRPDRIVIGECRGDETLDMLQAMNTGHDGSLTTLHANSPQDVMSRLDSLVLMGNVDLPVRAVREQIASAIDLIVHTARLSDGTRKIVRITEVTGMEANADIRLEDIFVFEQQGIGPQGQVLGEFTPTGYLPSFFDELKTKGMALDEAMFRPAVPDSLGAGPSE